MLQINVEAETGEVRNRQGLLRKRLLIVAVWLEAMRMYQLHFMLTLHPVKCKAVISKPSKRHNQYKSTLEAPAVCIVNMWAQSHLWFVVLESHLTDKWRRNPCKKLVSLSLFQYSLFSLPFYSWREKEKNIHTQKKGLNNDQNTILHQNKKKHLLTDKMQIPICLSS